MVLTETVVDPTDSVGQTTSKVIIHSSCSDDSGLLNLDYGDWCFLIDSLQFFQDGAGGAKTLLYIFSIIIFCLSFTFFFLVEHLLMLQIDNFSLGLTPHERFSKAGS